MSSRVLTRLVVGGVIGIALVIVTFVLTGIWWGTALTALLVYEGWTLANRQPRDTISEIVRDFSRHQLLVPWMFGAAFAVGLCTGYVHDPYLIAALGALQGHFFFTLSDPADGRSQ